MNTVSKSIIQPEEIRGKSKERILSAAIKLFAHEGYFGTSISKIAKEAGVSKSLMYNYFSSKEDLLNAIIEDALEHGNEMALEMQKARSPQEQLKYLIEKSFEWIMVKEEYAKMLMGLSIQVGKFPQIQKIVTEKLNEMRQFYIQLFRQLGFENAEMEANIFGALMDGLGLQYVSVGDLMGMQKIKEFLINKYCNIQPKAQ